MCWRGFLCKAEHRCRVCCCHGQFNSFWYLSCSFRARPFPPAFPGPAHPAQTGAEGKARVPLAGWLAAARCLAPCALLPARMNNYRSHKSVPPVQGALFAEQKDLEGLRGYGFKKTPAEWKKGCCHLLLTARGSIVPSRNVQHLFYYLQPCQCLAVWFFIGG